MSWFSRKEEDVVESDSGTFDRWHYCHRCGEMAPTLHECGGTYQNTLHTSGNILPLGVEFWCEYCGCMVNRCRHYS